MPLMTSLLLQLNRLLQNKHQRIRCIQPELLKSVSHPVCCSSCWRIVHRQYLHIGSTGNWACPVLLPSQPLSCFLTQLQRPLQGMLMLLPITSRWGLCVFAIFRILFICCNSSSLTLGFLPGGVLWLGTTSVLLCCMPDDCGSEPVCIAPHFSILIVFTNSVTHCNNCCYGLIKSQQKWTACSFNSCNIVYVIQSCDSSNIAVISCIYAKYMLI